MLRIMPPTHITEALTIVDKEVNAISAERRALGRFLTRLGDIQPSPTRPRTASDGHGRGVLLDIDRERSAGLEAVCEAYRQTVMSVAHFESDYDETFAENVAAELGPDIATQLVNASSLSPELKSAIASAVTDVRSKRGSFCRSLRNERESLSALGRSLNEIDSIVDELAPKITESAPSTQLSVVDDRLETLETRCRNLNGERQRVLHDGPTVRSKRRRVALPDYLYHDCDFRYPGLAALARRVDCIQNLRRACLR
ncbi:hypothetical protein [Halogeometricum sp. CBA1124]|uniref:DUF7260 family protein n=1 Tax=Halogeometricum sp. CBA1124 TaxID=2668071 RepID=UPI0014295246|nr:hypothetical protein [Halogeometricum sp. CBA1124]MUV56210.1 hypothetical protein [Halogeometricum sp. CBA1124]